MRARKSHPFVLALSLATALTLTALPTVVSAQADAPHNEQLSQPAKPRVSEQERMRAGSKIYGSNLMKRQERTDHRNKLRAMTSNEERDAYLQEHRLKMQERAKQRGLWLPGMPRTKSENPSPQNQ